MIRLLRWTLCCLSILLFALFGVEFFCRAFAFPQIAPPGLRRIVQTPEYHHTIRTNSLGLRENADIAREKPVREKRLFLVGDSFVFGTGLSEKQTLSSQLSKLLRDTPWRVINAGASGTGPLQYEHCVRQVAIPLKADLVAVFFYIGNDLENTWDPYIAFPHSIKNWAKIFFPNTYLWACGWKYNRRAHETRDGPRVVGYDPWDQAELYRWGLREGIPRPEMRKRYDRLPMSVRKQAMGRHYNASVLYSALTHPQIINDTSTLHSDEMQMALKRCLATLQNIQKDCKKAGIPLVLVSIPAGWQVNDKQWDFWRKVGFDINPLLVSQNRPQQKLSGFCEKLDVPCLDLLPALKQARIRPLHFPIDGHWRAPTARYVAKTLRNFLSQNFLL